MTPCPSKRSHINPALPPRVCFETCARFSYAAHLSGGEWLKPAIAYGKCENHIPRVRPDLAAANPAA